MTPLLFIISILATYRIVYMIQNEDAPFAILYKMRKALRIEPECHNHVIKKGSFRAFMSCFKCLSIWFAAIFSTLLCYGDITLIVLSTLAISAGAIILNNFCMSRGI